MIAISFSKAREADAALYSGDVIRREIRFFGQHFLCQAAFFRGIP